MFKSKLRARRFLLLACLSALGCHGSSSAPRDGGVDDLAESDDASMPDMPVSSPLPTLITEPDQGMAPIYALISSARHTLDMTMYELNDPMATSLLLAAAKSGVKVRVILDQNLEMQSNTTAYQALSGVANVTVHWANPVYAATHQKTITVDGTTAAIMTLNFAAEDYPTSRDFALITTDAADIAAIETTFAADLVDAPITPPNGTNLVWSPTNSESVLIDLINAAQTSLLVENEEMGYANIVTALVNAAARGVDVKIVIEASRSYNANFMLLEAAGAQVVTYRGNGLYIHAKIIVSDYGSSHASIFLGSENFSHPSLDENRELGLITTDAATMSSLNATLTSDFAGGTPFGMHLDFGAPIDAGVGDAAPDAASD